MWRAGRAQDIKEEKSQQKMAIKRENKGDNKRARRKTKRKQLKAENSGKGNWNEERKRPNIR